VSESGAPIPDPYLGAHAASGPSRTSGNAIASLVTSLLGFVCLPAIGGLLGVALGVAAKSEIHQSGGKIVGKGLATTGIALGAVNVIVSVLGLAGLVSFIDSIDASPAAPPTAVAAPVIAPAPSPTPAPTVAPGTSGPASSSSALSRQGGIVVTKVGKVTLIDVDHEVRSLRAELGKQAELAKKERAKLLLWMVAPDCQPCNGVSASLTDPLMQEALGGTRIVRVNVRDFSVELAYLGIPVQKIPGFALLGPEERAVDYVHGGEWDDDIAKNIAPVLGKFVRGDYRTRREPWRGGARDDETAL
jgi:hypothetical protein